jgi:glycogen synthase
MKVSVVINTLNRFRYLADALISMRQQDFREFEVIVVKGPCTDDTDAVLAQYREQLKILLCSHANLSMSRNIGIRASSGDIVAFIDDDAVADPRWLTNIVAGYDQSEVAAVGGFVFDNTGYSYQCRYNICDRFCNTISPIKADSTDLLSCPGAWFFSSTIGTNSSFRRDLLLTVGGFDEAYIYNCDETDVCLRLIDSGYRIKIVPNAVVYHRYAQSYMRDDKKIPTTLYPSAVCKSYFSFRNGAAASNVQAVFKELDRYSSELNMSNDWLYNNSAISQEKKEQLTGDIVRGLKDGMQRALTEASRALIPVQDQRAPTAPFLKFLPKYSMPPGKKLRICLMTTDYPPRPVNGIGRWTHLLAQGLRDLEQEVHVYTTGNSNTVNFEDGIWVHGLCQMHYPHKRLNLPFELPQSTVDLAYTMYEEVIRCWAMAPFDIISYPIWEQPGLACLLDPSLPVLVSLHSAYGLIQPYKADWHESTLYYTNHVRPIIASEQYVWQRAPALIANSDVIVEEYKKRFGLQHSGAIYKVPHGVDEPAAPNVFANEKSAVSKVTVLYVGRLERRKGIDLLLDAIPSVIEACPQVHFVICGEEVIEEIDQRPYGEMFIAQHQDREDIINAVSFVGRVYDNELQDLYRTCDVFVGPSRFESFGLIFIEAMAVGKPVIALDRGGAREIITNGKEGYLVKRDDPADLARAIIAVVADEHLRRKMSKASLTAFQQKFTTRIMSTNMLNTYRRFIEQRERAVAQPLSGAR